MVENRTPAADAPRIITPAWAVRRAREIYAPIADRVLGSGVHIIGDPMLLKPTTEPVETTDAEHPEAMRQVPIDAAVELALGIYRAAERELRVGQDG